MITKTNPYSVIKNKWLGLYYSKQWDNPAFVMALTIITYLLMVLLRFVLFSRFWETGAIGDDYIYKGMALGFFKQGDFFAINYMPPIKVPNYLYSLLISPSFFFGDHFYIIIKLINSLIINASLFPVFLLAKEFMNRKRAYFISVAALTIPYLNIGNVAMCEVLYFPLFLLAFYWSYKLLTDLRLKYAVLSGLAMGLLYITKPHALFFITAFVLTAGLISFIRDRSQRLRILLVTFVSLAVIPVVVLGMNFIILGHSGLVLHHYNALVKRKLKFSLLLNPQVISLFVSNITFFLMVYLYPFWVSILSLIKTIKEKKHPKGKDSLLLLGLSFTVVITGLMVVLLIGSDVYLRDLRIPSRFYFMIYPFYIIVFAAFYRQIEWKIKQKIILTLLFFITLALNLTVFIPNIILTQKYCHLITSMDMLWVSHCWCFWGKPGIVLFFLIQLLGLGVLIYYLFRKKKSVFPYMIFFLLVGLLANFSTIKKMEQKNDNLISYRNTYLPFVDKNIPIGSDKVALISPMRNAKQGYFSFWRHFDYTAFLRLPENSEITPHMITSETRWILVEGDYKLKFPVKMQERKGKYSILELPYRGFVVTNGSLNTGGLGYVLAAHEGKMAIALKDIPNSFFPIVRLSLKMKSLSKPVMNGAVIFKDYTCSSEGNYISVWVQMGAQKYVIREMGQGFHVVPVSKQAVINPDAVLNIKIEINLQLKRIDMWVEDKKVLSTNYLGNISAVNQVGFCTVNSTTTFSHIVIEKE